MPVAPQDRNPKSQHDPAKQIKAGGDPESLDKETIAWQFHRLDRPHEKWGWDKLKASQWKQILRDLVALEGLTWAKLKEQSGGKNKGTNHHAIPMKDFSKSAKARINELHLDQFDTLFSLRLANTLRLYGIRNGRVLQLIWHDPHHGGTEGCYPLKR